MEITETYDNSGLTGVVLSQLRPDRSELGDRWSSLIDDSSVPPRIVVYEKRTK
jgi:hypothetical protein